MRFATRGDVDPFIVMDVMEAARQREEAGARVIHMEVGQPSIGAPRSVRQRVAAAMEAGPLGYTVALGLPELRRGIAGLYRRWYGIDLDPERVVVTTGSSAGFQLAFTALFDSGERVAIAEPGYPCYRHILHALGLQPAGFQLDPARGYLPDPQDIPGGVAGLLLASPANPTGTMLPRGALEALVQYCRERDIAFISDEIYHGISYGTKEVTALELSDDAFVINSFSKFFALTGWRVGWMVVPQSQIRRIERLAQNFYICAPHASQIAALAALDAVEEMEEVVKGYARSRALLLDALPRIGFPKLAPADGAFYFYAETGALGDSAALARRILNEADVAVTPGLDFDPQRGAGTLRFSYARSLEDMEEAVARIGALGLG